MDLRSIKLRLLHGHVRAVIADSEGEHGCDLEGAPAARVFAAAGGLLAALARETHGAEIRSLSLDMVGHVARISLRRAAWDTATASPGLRIAGPRWGELAPLIRNVARTALRGLAESGKPAQRKTRR
jgi:hypothetical protein